MTPVRFLAEARQDLFAAAAYYNAESPGLGEEFLRVVDDVVAEVSAHPRIGSPYEDTTRQVVLPRFPFNLIYHLEAETVVITAVAHHRRDPEFWRGRSEGGGAG